MLIRHLEPADIKELERIHSFYKDEFPLSDLTCPHNYVDKFAVADDHNKIITVGGVRAIAEVIAITDKSRSVRDRRTALIKLLITCGFVSKDVFDSLHVFIQDPNWEIQLLKYGFKPTKGRSLYFNIR